MPTKIDWTGIKIHKLIFMKPTETRSHGFIRWEAQCDCGKICIVTPNDVKQGKQKSCGCYKLSGEIRREHNPIISSAHKIWNCNYDDGDIDFDTFFRLSQLNCSYCGSSPSTVFNRAENNASENQKINGFFIYNGLDRINSSIGHLKSNVITCCFTCNHSKFDRTIEDFIAHIKLQYENLKHIRNGEKFSVKNYDLTKFPIPNLNSITLNASSRRKHHPIISSAYKVWDSNYRDGNISLEEFYALSQMNCEYCGKSPYLLYNVASSRKKNTVSEYQIIHGNYVYNGLDRVDSSKNHTIDNVVPCCFYCNFSKLDMTLNEFVNHNEKQYNYLSLNNFSITHI